MRNDFLIVLDWSGPKYESISKNLTIQIRHFWIWNPWNPLGKFVKFLEMKNEKEVQKFSSSKITEEKKINTNHHSTSCTSDDRGPRISNDWCFRCVSRSSASLCSFNSAFLSRFSRFEKQKWPKLWLLPQILGQSSDLDDLGFFPEKKIYICGKSMNPVSKKKGFLSLTIFEKNLPNWTNLSRFRKKWSPGLG